MPLYEYRCRSCGESFEVIQKFSDRPLKKCRACSGPLEKLISRSSFQLRGGGWCVNNYSASKPAAPAIESESKPATVTAAPKTCCGSGSCSN